MASCHFIVLQCLVICSLLVLCNCNTRQPWSKICPDDQCQEIVLSRVNKANKTFNINYGEGRIFCLKPMSEYSLKGIKNVWYNYRVSIATNSTPGSTLFAGNSTARVLIQLQSSRSSNSGSSWFSSEGQAERVTEVRSSPYKVQCLGVKILKGQRGGKVTVYFTQSFQISFLVLFILGLLLFVSSPHVTKNTAFYYSGGIAIGVVASLLILLYIFSKFVPKKNVLGLGILVGGYSFAGYLLHVVYSQGIEFVKDNLAYLLVYSIIAGLISFAVLYRIGPAHPRSLQLIQWFLQLIGLGLIFLSFIQLYMIGVLMIVLILIWYNMPVSLSRKLKLWFFNRSLPNFFSSKQTKKYLTPEEYEKQGVVETEKALNELRAYCRSGAGNSKFWERKLPNMQHQTKFLDFLSGKDHVNDGERDLHEVEFPSLYEEDSSNDDSSSIPSSTSSPYLSSHNASSRSPSLSPRYHDHYYS